MQISRLLLSSLRFFLIVAHLKIGKPVLAIYIAFCVVMLSACTRQEQVGLGPGMHAPQIYLHTLDGAPFSLQDAVGKVVLLNFWATWCAPCIEELPELEKVQQLFSGQPFTVLSIGVDDSLERFINTRREFGLTFPILFDAGSTTRGPYKLAGLPESFVLDRQGKIAMILDPERQEPVTRIIGPRDWSTEPFLSQFRALISQP